MASDNQITGNIGLFYACYHLSLRDWNVIPTSRNTRGIDIIIYNSDGTQYKGIQVKTLSKRGAIPLGSKLDDKMGDFWVIVNNARTDSPNVFVLPLDEVKKRANRNQKNDKVSYWLEYKDYELDKYRNAWDSLGKAF